MKNITDQQEFYDQTFERIDLQQGQIQGSEFTDCSFIQCNFESAILQNCRFTNCTFLECRLNLAKITGSSFSDTHFQKSRLMGVNWTEANWSISSFGDLVRFSDCVLSHATFIGLTLKKLQVKNCIARDVDFREADLSGADFKGTDLDRSFFGSTNLTAADLSQARNYEIDPGNNQLKGAKFSLPEAMALLYNMDIILEEPNEAVW